jgi:hypothetical protein
MLTDRASPGAACVKDAIDCEHIHAEHLDVHERLILAPENGLFASHHDLLSAANPARVDAGDEIGVVVLHSGEKHAVLTSFSGFLLGLLVLPGERVRPMQPVAWMTTDR